MFINLNSSFLRNSSTKYFTDAVSYKSLSACFAVETTQAYFNKLKSDFFSRIKNLIGFFNDKISIMKNQIK